MTDIASRLWDAICEMQAADGGMTKAGFVRRYEEILAAAKNDDQPAMTPDALRAAMYKVTALLAEYNVKPTQRCERQQGVIEKESGWDQNNEAFSATLRSHARFT